MSEETKPERPAATWNVAAYTDIVGMGYEGTERTTNWIRNEVKGKVAKDALLAALTYAANYFWDMHNVECFTWEEVGLCGEYNAGDCMGCPLYDEANDNCELGDIHQRVIELIDKISDPEVRYAVIGGKAIRTAYAKAVVYEE